MEQPASADRKFFRLLWYRAYLPNLLLAIGQGAIIPVLAITAKNLGASAPLAAFIVSLNGLGTMIMDVPAGWIASRLGEKRAATSGAMLLLIGLACCLFARSPILLGLGVFLQATGWSIWSLVRLINISRIASPTIRGRAISTFGGVSRGGRGVGPLLVAAFATQGSTRVSFVIYFVCAIVGWAWLEVARDRADHGATHVERARHRPVATVRTHRREFATAGVSSYLLGILRSSRQVVLPLWGVHLGLSVTDISLVYGISSMLDLSLFYPSGYVSDRFGRRAVVLPCIGLLALGHLLLPLTHSLPDYFAIGLLLGFGNGLGAGIVMTLGADRAPKENRPAFLALWRFVSDSGAASGPIVDGLLIGALGLAAAAPVVGFVGIGATAFTWRFLRETVAFRRTSPAVE